MICGRAQLPVLCLCQGGMFHLLSVAMRCGICTKANQAKVNQGEFNSSEQHCVNNLQAAWARILKLPTAEEKHHLPSIKIQGKSFFISRMFEYSSCLFLQASMAFISHQPHYGLTTMTQAFLPAMFQTHRTSLTV